MAGVEAEGAGTAGAGVAGSGGRSGRDGVAVWRDAEEGSGGSGERSGSELTGTGSGGGVAVSAVERAGGLDGGSAAAGGADGLGGGSGGGAGGGSGVRAVWLAAGSAVAAMLAVTWYQIVHNGGVAPGGDMIGHAAAAEWLRTLPWWDWRGWSDWFYGGQAIGVNYPPLPHAVGRFIHLTYGQMAAVTVALLGLLPWGTLRLARAVGFGPRGERVAVGAVLVVVCWSGGTSWLLPSFHQHQTYFGSWPVVVASSLGLFCAAWAARCERPLVCGLVAGVALLFNPTVMPGVAVVCVVLVSTSGISWRRALHWGLTAGLAAVATCAWWLVPFTAGLARLVRWEISLASIIGFTGTLQTVLLMGVAVAVAWAYRSGSPPAQRLAIAAAAGLLATFVADLAGWWRTERWLVASILAACASLGELRIGGLGISDGPSRRPGRAGQALGVALVTGFVVVTDRWEVVPLVVWLLWWPRRAWVAAGAVAWAGVLLFVPLLAQFRYPPEPEKAPDELPALVFARGGSGAAGLIYTDTLFNLPPGDVAACGWGVPWRAAATSAGRLRALDGIHRETSHLAEFLHAEENLRQGVFAAENSQRPHWFAAWHDSGRPTLATPAAAGTFGARWYASCDPGGNVSVQELPGSTATGVKVAAFGDESAWHRAAVNWWMPIAAGTAGGDALAPVPVLAAGSTVAHPADRAAAGVSLLSDGDRLRVYAETAGWAWLRIPWDPDWRAAGTPVHLGGPGHLVVWAEQGETELTWSVPREVDVAAAVITGAATLAAFTAAFARRRRRSDPSGDGSRESAEAAVPVRAGS